MARSKKSAVTKFLSAIGRKGGAKKVPKGLALLSEEARAKIRAKGLETRRQKAVQRAAEIRTPPAGSPPL
jgi:hypothetical protein